MISPAAPFQASPFHEGEIALQRSVGMAERMAGAGARVIRDFMPDQHRDFYAQLPFIVAATVDPAGDVWPTILSGKPGFVSSPSPTALTVGALPYAGDPALAGTHVGAAIGMLGIELHTRRRNRINGTISASSTNGFTVKVGHSFGNCPRYIQLRDYSWQRNPADAPEPQVEEQPELTAQARAIISAADTFFVASYAEPRGERQVDVSHRGGRPGFVRVGADGRLTVPDFSGNFFFNTLGNFIVNPRAGLLFVDFQTGDVLQIAGNASIVTDSPEIAAFEGAERLWTFEPTRVVLRRGASPLRWKMRENGFSPASLKTGSWNEAAQISDNPGQEPQP